jgi:hypothetical protein
MTNAILAQANNGAGGFLVGTGLIFLLLGLLYFCAWIYALYSAATSSSLNGGERVVWLLILIFLPGIGTLLYFLLAGRGK